MFDYFTPVIDELSKNEISNEVVCRINVSLEPVIEFKHVIVLVSI